MPISDSSFRLPASLFPRPLHRRQGIAKVLLPDLTVLPGAVAENDVRLVIVVHHRQQCIAARLVVERQLQFRLISWMMADRLRAAAERSGVLGGHIFVFGVFLLLALLEVATGLAQ